MTRTRASSSLAIATALTGCALSLALAAPMAHADPVVDSISNTVKNDRGKYASQCPPLNYSPALEAIAQRYDLTANPATVENGNYNGQRIGFRGQGDPQAAATTDAYQKGAGAMLSRCDYTEFGVAFYRIDPTGPDWVAIVFGMPAAAPKPAEVPKPADVPAPVVPAPVVPAPVVPVPVVTPPVTDAIALSFGPAGFGSITATVKNSSDLTAKCTYDASGLSNTHRDFTVSPKGQQTLTFNGFNTGSSYHVVVSCHDASGTQPQEIGHAEQDVTF
jgi:hypothetical protein